MTRLFLLSIFFTAVSMTAHAQGRIGATLEELKAEFDEDGNQYQVEHQDDGEVRFLAEYEDLFVIHIMSSEYSPVHTTFGGPKSYARLHGLIEYYNNNFVTVSPTEWRRYTTEGVLKISLDFDEKGERIPCIYWTKIEE